MLLVFVLGTLVPMNTFAQNKTQTFLLGRIGIQQDRNTTYRLVEVFQVRGKWVAPDVGYIDFADATSYREVYIGGGAVLLNTEHLTIIGEIFLDKATGDNAGGALYLLPWTYVGYRFSPKIISEAVYFPYLPLNQAGTVQHVLERAKVEYIGIKPMKVGLGYGGYQFGDEPWQNKPFITSTLQTSRFGNLELWLQKIPGTAQVQIRYTKVF